MRSYHHDGEILPEVEDVHVGEKYRCLADENLVGTVEAVRCETVFLSVEFHRTIVVPLNKFRMTFKRIP